jgi:hypothetical protein
MVVYNGCSGKIHLLKQEDRSDGFLVYWHSCANPNFESVIRVLSSCAFKTTLQKVAKETVCHSRECVPSRGRRGMPGNGANVGQ